MTHTDGRPHAVPTIALAVAVLAIGCTPTTTETPDTPPPDPEELMEADRAFDQETARTGVEGWVAAFAENGVMLRPGGEVRGHEAIREIMTPAFADPGFSLRWEPRFADVGSGGDLGYTVGRYLRQTVSAEGDTVRAEGQYTTIWKRGEDGAWRVVLDLGVPDPEGS
jgi:ketosteroid isomerase-like protein